MITRRAMLSAALAIPLRSATLPEQSAAAILDRKFPDPNISYLLLHSTSGRLVCSRWTNFNEPLPLGSLVKPFTALAYAATHDFHFPEFECLGDSSQCWLPQGHGYLEISAAIAHSCNAYFLNLARDVQPEALEDVAHRFGLQPPRADADAGVLIGLGSEWRNSPLAITRAYSELAARSGEPETRELLAGMALCARSGTGSGIGAGSFAKTGTAPCTHEARHRGDGFAIALYPMDAPRYVLLTRLHGAPGRSAAVICGRMRRALAAS